jgi:hypothetical protein
MNTFTFTLVTESGHSYKYTGTIESLYKHLQANAGTKVIEDETRFTGQE